MGGKKLTGWGKNGPAYFFPGEKTDWGEIPACYIGISDHEAVYIEASLCQHKTPQPPRVVFCYNKADLESIKKGLLTLHRDTSTMLSTPVDKLWTLFKKPPL